jgi:hypothetical protein
MDFDNKLKPKPIKLKETPTKLAGSFRGYDPENYLPTFGSNAYETYGKKFPVVAEAMKRINSGKPVTFLTQDQGGGVNNTGYEADGSMTHNKTGLQIKKILKAGKEKDTILVEDVSGNIYEVWLPEIKLGE